MDGEARRSRERARDLRQQRGFIDAAIVDVKDLHLDDVMQLRSQVGEDCTDVPDRGIGLRTQISRVENIALAVQVDLTTDKHHVTATETMLVCDLDRPVPVALR